MKIKVEKKHIRLGKPQKGKCPLSLAFQEVLNLDERLVLVSPMCLTLHDYHGASVYVCELPQHAKDFYKNYFSYFENIEKMQRLPRPISFEMGAVDYLEAGSFDQLLYISNKINDLT
jgi:hypothetical protein